MQSKFEAWIPKLGSEVDATKPAWRFVPCLMRTKLEASSWIPKLGCYVHVSKPAWRFDAIEIRSLDSEAWTLKLGCEVDATKSEWGLMRSKSGQKNNAIIPTYDNNKFKVD